MSELEQRYRRLLRAYPRSYREARSDEMLGTLLESSAAGKSRPTAKDTRALIMGGLRVRAGFDQRLTAGTSVRLVVLLAACLDIVYEAEFWFRDVRGSWGYTFPAMAYSWFSLVLGLFAVATVALAWSRWRVVTLIVTAATAALWLYHAQGRDWIFAIQPVLALAAIAVVTLDPECPPPPRNWLWLPGALLLAELATVIIQANTSIRPGVDYVPFILLAATILWSIVDARPMAAVAMWIACTMGWGSARLVSRPSGFTFGRFLAGWVWESLALVALAVTILGIFRLRRQSVL